MVNLLNIASVKKAAHGRFLLLLMAVDRSRRRTASAGIVGEPARSCSPASGRAQDSFRGSEKY